MAEDIYARYAELERQVAKMPKFDPSAVNRVPGGFRNMKTHPPGPADPDAPRDPNRPTTNLSEAVARMRARIAGTKARAEIARRESQLSLVNPQLIANAQALNQRAATEGQVYSTRSAEGTADLAGGQDGDTETPGGTSGRRRRTSAAVGSIRI